MSDFLAVRISRFVTERASCEGIRFHGRVGRICGTSRRKRRRQRDDITPNSGCCAPRPGQPTAMAAGQMESRYTSLSNEPMPRPESPTRIESMTYQQSLEMVGYGFRRIDYRDAAQRFTLFSLPPRAIFSTRHHFIRRRAADACDRTSAYGEVENGASRQALDASHSHDGAAVILGHSEHQR